MVHWSFIREPFIQKRENAQRVEHVKKKHIKHNLRQAQKQTPIKQQTKHQTTNNKLETNVNIKSKQSATPKTTKPKQNTRASRAEPNWGQRTEPTDRAKNRLRPTP